MNNYKINISIDLDKTLINNKFSYYQNIKINTYKIKRNFRKSLYELYNNNYIFYLITSRQNNEEKRIK